MHLTKRQSWAYAAATLVLFFILGNILLARQERRGIPVEQPQGTAASPAASPGPGPEGALTLNEFHRSETRNGQKLWEVKATRGRYFPEDRKAVLEDAHLWFYKAEGETITLHAEAAEIFFDQASLSRALLSRGVSLMMNDSLQIETDSAEYDNNTKHVFAPGAVSIKNERTEIHGKELKADLESRAFTLAHEVTTTIKGRSKEVER